MLIDAPVAAPPLMVVADSSVYVPVVPVAGLADRVKVTGWLAWQAAAGLDRLAAGTRPMPAAIDSGPV